MDHWWIQQENRFVMMKENWGDQLHHDDSRLAFPTSKSLLKRKTPAIYNRCLNCHNWLNDIRYYEVYISNPCKTYISKKVPIGKEVWHANISLAANNNSNFPGWREQAISTYLNKPLFKIQTRLTPFCVPPMISECINALTRFTLVFAIPACGYGKVPAPTR